MTAMCPTPPEEELEEALPLTAEERETLRAKKLTEKKLCIAMLGSAIISDPNNNVKFTFSAALCSQQKCIQLFFPE